MAGFSSAISFALAGRDDFALRRDRRHDSATGDGKAPDGEPKGDDARMITVYGIRNCDTCRKGEGIAHRFHDLREDGIDASKIADWMEALGWQSLLNTRSTTWRGLDEAEKADPDAARAAALMLAHPTLVKRPVFDLGGGKYALGFKADAQEALRKAAG
jgi:arsenate reductase